MLFAVSGGSEHERGILLECIVYRLKVKPCINLGGARVRVIERSADEGKAVALGGEPATQGPVSSTHLLLTLMPSDAVQRTIAGA